MVFLERLDLSVAQNFLQRFEKLGLLLQRTLHTVYVQTSAFTPLAKGYFSGIL